MMRGAAVIGAVFSIGVFGCSAPDGEANSAAGGIEAAVLSINQDDYARRLGVIAHDSMSGRYTPSPGLSATAAWIAGEFEAMGLEPMGDEGSYLQQYSLGDVMETPPTDDAGEPLSAPNVVAVLEGSDPTLKDEYIVFSAHMDHVGIRRAVDGDSIYNGADDDGSGTIGIVELAEAFASMETPPRRSLIFLLVSGEERGLLGSRYFAGHMPVATEAVVANLNMDMIGRNWPDTIVAIGKEHSDLGETLNAVNTAHPELGMTAIDDVWPDERFYFRSDHYNFARQGIPILFFFNGVHDDYHRPSDQVEKIDFEKASRIVQLVFYLGLEIADNDARPVWNPESYTEIVEGEGGRRR